MKRRTVLISLFFSTLGLLGMKYRPQSRIVDWPKQKHKQDLVLAEQWLEHYRITEIFADDTAGFEFVV